MSTYGQNKATLSRILEVALANTRAEKDLLGLVGIKGSFLMDNAGAISNVKGEGFTVVASPGIAGAFKIYFNVAPLAILDINIQSFIDKDEDADASDYAADISGYNITATSPYVTGRGYKPSNLAVAAPAAGTAESTDFTCEADVNWSLAGEYILFSSPSADYYAWFKVGTHGSDPMLPGRTGIEVDIAKNDLAGAVATALAAAVPADFAGSALAAVCTILNVNDGAPLNLPTKGNTGWAVAPAVTVVGSSGYANFYFDIKVIYSDAGTY